MWTGDHSGGSLRQHAIRRAEESRLTEDPEATSNATVAPHSVSHGLKQTTV